MRAVRCSDGRIDVVEVAEPAGDGVRVRIRSAGICGSDLHMIAGGFPIESTLGHEMAGETDDGTPVAIEPIAACGACRFCADGAYNLCVEGPGSVLGVGRDGGMCDVVRVPERCLVPLPRGVSPEDACLVEPLAVAVHGFVQAGLRGDQSVAIVGGGSIGLSALAVSVASGARTVLVARHDHQRAAAERLGGDTRLAEGYDIAVDAAGTRSSLEQCVQIAKPGGTLLLLATYWDGLELPGFLLCMKEVRVVPSMMYGRRSIGRDIDIAASVLAANPTIASTLITHRFPLDGAAEAFETAAARSSGAIKVVLEP